jgi:hypothetical protein
MSNLVSSIEQPALEEVFKKKGAKISNVRVVVHCGSTGVETNPSWLKGDELLYHSGETVVETNGHRDSFCLSMLLYEKGGEKANEWEGRV